MFSTFAALAIFPAAYNVAIPGTDAAGPSLATVAFEVLHGVYIHNMVTIIWLVTAVMMTAKTGVRLTIPTSAWRFSGLIALLGAVGLISTIANGARFSTLADLGEAGRILLLSFYFLLMFHWAQKHGPGFIMRWYLAGLAIGGLVNIYFSITNPYNFVGTVPFLYSRNGGGGFLALGVALGAWMWNIRDRLSTSDRIISLGAALVGIVAVAMSFSKTAMIIGALGLASWALVLNVSPLKIIQNRFIVWLVLATGIVLVVMPAGTVSAVLDDVNQSVQIKFASISSPEANNSLRDRLDYYVVTAEILADNPANSLVGVGYSGFYPSVIRTPAYFESQLDEDPTNGKNSNPHNSFLYYAAANGLPGLFVTLSLYLASIKAFFRSIRGPHWLAYGIAATIALVYMSYASALPTLFKTEVMYLPVAAALSAGVRPKLGA